MRPNNNNTGKPVRMFTEKHLENIRSMFISLYNDELLADVTLCCKNGTLKAHKLVLAASSPYFRKVFIENSREHPVFIMHGIDFAQLKNLIELIYRGSVDIPGDAFNSVYNLAEELDVTGFAVDDNTLPNGIEANGSSNSYGRDTRFKGQKRVAVDYKENLDSDGTPSKISKSADRRRSTSSEKATFKKNYSDKENMADSKASGDAQDRESGRKPNESAEMGDRSLGDEPESKSNNVWAKKLRKFKCELCPSSFKRASHLTRHQLVHTGERPYACDQCDKAFSRHDKLKHHIRKTHEAGCMDLNCDLPPDALYTIGHVRILTPEPIPPAPSPPPPAPQKKGRGRPRKYPIVPPPLVKRPRGRPRLNPVVLAPQIGGGKGDNYDITNLPFGDIEYLTKPLNENNDEMEDSVLMEPLVEIKYESVEKPDRPESPKCSNTFLGGIGLFENNVAKIGECTISVANTTP